MGLQNNETMSGAQPLVLSTLTHDALEHIGALLEPLELISLRMSFMWAAKVLPSGSRPSIDGICVAARRGQLDLLQWAHRFLHYPFHDELCAQGASGGQLEVLQWLRLEKPPCPWDEWTCVSAA
jgi:hypothetical protein